MFKTLNTKDADAHAHKTLLYAHHGFGKTYQFRYYRELYGRGLIISGESGLSSVSDCDIDFLPFSSWDGKHDPDKGVYSFMGIIRMLKDVDLKAAGFNWIGIDSVTEMSERALAHFQQLHEDAASSSGKKMDGFAVWGDYERAMIGALKWVRDLPVHVLVTALAMEEDDDNGQTNYWPMVKMKKVAKHIPALFDHVFCGIRKTAEVEGSGGIDARVARFIITEEVKGWHGKTRDPHRRLKPIERSANILQLHQRMAMTPEAYERYVSAVEGGTSKAEEVAKKPTTSEGE